MNIMFADLQPSSVNLSEPAVDQELGDGKFSDLMDQELNQSDDLSANAGYSQVTDTNELNDVSDTVLVLQGDLVTGPEVPAAWLEYLANQPTDATSGEATTPLAVQVVEADIASLTEETAGVLRGAINPAIGEQLPVAGKSLPSAVNSQATAPVSMIQKDLVRQTNMLDQVRVEDIDSNELKHSDLTNTGTLKNLIANALNADVTAESAKRFKNGEFQVISNAVSDIADSASNIRTQNPSIALANGITQPTNPLLPTQLETLTVANTRDTAAWSNGIGERVHYMINQKMNTATIRLDPPMLGRLEVHIQVNDDITNVTINTQHAQTRELIDNASFKLRDFLQENGYGNVNVDVSHQEENQQQASEQTDDGSGDVSEDGLSAQAGDNMLEQQGNQYFSSDSVVDYFA